MKRKVLVVAAIVAVISILSVGTLAWYSDSQEKVNKFIVSSDGEGQPDFSVDLIESVNDEVSDVVPTVIYDDDQNPTGLKYDAILPGDYLSKEPKAVNTGAYDEYIKITVTLVGDAEQWAEMVPGFQLTSCLKGVDPDIFVFDNISDDGMTVVYYYNKILAPGATSEPVFLGFEFPEEATVENSPVSFDLKVKADAVQTRNIVDPDDYATVALAAKAAFTVLGA